jgi:hypothetical protein
LIHRTGNHRRLRSVGHPIVISEGATTQPGDDEWRFAGRQLSESVSNDTKESFFSPLQFACHSCGPLVCLVHDDTAVYHEEDPPSRLTRHLLPKGKSEDGYIDTGGLPAGSGKINPVGPAVLDNLLQ